MRCLAIFSTSLIWSTGFRMASRSARELSASPAMGLVSMVESRYSWESYVISGLLIIIGENVIVSVVYPTGLFIGSAELAQALCVAPEVLRCNLATRRDFGLAGSCQQLCLHARKLPSHSL